MSGLECIYPQWDAPENVRVLVTTRQGGVSLPPFASFNLAMHVGDNVESVQQNRQLLQQELPAPVQLQWLEQVHGTEVITASPWSTGETPRADAIFITEPDIAGVVMTADCLPVFFSDTHGRCVAVAHAGWKGLLDGILEKTLACFALPREQIIAWMGPAIGPCHFEVGTEVRDMFLARCQSTAETVAVKAAFHKTKKTDKWLADIYALARQRLQAAGVFAISGGTFCTVCETERFYSYRREGSTGRMASLIYLTDL